MATMKPMDGGKGKMADKSVTKKLSTMKTPPMSSEEKVKIAKQPYKVNTSKVYSDVVKRAKSELLKGSSARKK